MIIIIEAGAISKKSKLNHSFPLAKDNGVMRRSVK